MCKYDSWDKTSAFIKFIKTTKIMLKRITGANNKEIKFWEATFD